MPEQCATCTWWQSAARHLTSAERERADVALCRSATGPHGGRVTRRDATCERWSMWFEAKEE